MDTSHAAPAAHTAHLSEPPDENFGQATGGKVGMWMFIAQDGMAFGGLLLAYGLMRVWADAWPAPGLRPTNVLGISLTAFATFVLICSSVSMVMAVQASQHARKSATVSWLLLTIAGGLTFLGIQAYEYTHLVHQGITLSHGTFNGQVLHPLFGATFFVVTGFHGAHVTAGVIYLTCILFGAMKGKYTRGGLSYSPVELVGLFWHFVDLVWILVFTFIYLL
jgi:heme/copper-type cytochrome/quinol oxidase subunit 3